MSTALLIHGGDLGLGQWAFLGFVYLVMPLLLLVFAAFRLGAYLRKREQKKQAEGKR